MAFDYALAGVVTAGLLVYLTYAPDPNPPTGTYEDATQTLPQAGHWPLTPSVSRRVY